MDVIVRDDPKIKLLSYVLSLTDYPEKEQERRPHAVHKILSETRRQLDMYTSLSAVTELKNYLNNNIWFIFIQAYVFSLNWPELEAEKFPVYIPEFIPEIVHSNYNTLLREFYHQTSLSKLWKQHDRSWKDACDDTKKCFRNIKIKDLLTKLFGKLNYDLVFFPNILVPQLISTGPSSTTELCCVARTPGPAELGMSVKSFYEDCNWVRIVAFHEYCHPLMDEVYRANKEVFNEIKKVAKNGSVLNEYRKYYPDWEDLFTEILIYSMTIVFLRYEVSLNAAKDFEQESREKTGIKNYDRVADIIEEYLIEHEKGNYNTISEYFPEIINKLKN